MNPTEPCCTPLNTSSEDETQENPHNPHSDSGRSLVSKIARLPDPVREQLNRRLRDGEPASTILPWLNALPEVKAILASQFESRLISEKNLSKWRHLGYERWLQRQEPYKEITALAEEAGVLSRAGGNQIARGAATIVSAQIMKLLKEMKNCTMEELAKTARAITALVRAEQNYVRLEHEKTAMHLKNEMVTLHWDKHQRTVISIMQRGLEDEQAKVIQALPISNEAKIEMLGVRVYGNGWKGREVPLTDNSSPAPITPPLNPRSSGRQSAPIVSERRPPVLRSSTAEDGSASGPSSEPQGGSVIQPGVAPKTFGATPGSDPNNSPNPERVASNPESSPTSAVVAPNPQDKNAGSATSSLSQRERVGVRESCPNENPPPIHNEGELKSSGRKSAPIEVGQVPHACAPDAPSSDSGPQTVDSGQKMLPPKMPLTAYQEAINEGKSPEEAEAASKYCSPAKRAQRIREYEQYRKELAAYEAQVNSAPVAKQIFHNPSQLSGFSPHQPQPAYHSPLGEIHHPSDRWRVQTS